MLKNGIKEWAPDDLKKKMKKVVLQLSSPQMACEMTSQQLAATIVGDSISAMLKFSGVECYQMDTVINCGCEGDSIENQKQVFSLIQELSRKEFDAVYRRLGIAFTKRNYKFYMKHFRSAYDELKGHGMIKAAGSRIGLINGKKLLLLKGTDGNCTTVAADLSALRYNLVVENPGWIIYVGDKLHLEHYKSYFNIAKCVGWLPDDGKPTAKLDYVGLDVMDAEIPSVFSLLDGIKNRFKEILTGRGLPEEKREKVAEILASGGLKYAILQNRRDENCIDDILQEQGDNAFYIQGLYVRTCQDISESGLNIQDMNKDCKVICLQKLSKDVCFNQVGLSLSPS